MSAYTDISIDPVVRMKAEKILDYQWEMNNGNELEVIKGLTAELQSEDRDARGLHAGQRRDRLLSGRQPDLGRGRIGAR